MQQAVKGLTFLTTVGGALWYGGEDRLGKTFWKSIDSSVLSAMPHGVQVGFHTQF